MRGVVPTIGVLLVIAGPAPAEPAKDLVGSWRSNRELTAREMHKSPRVTPEQRMKLEPLFGELVFVYTATKATGYIEGGVFVTPYKVVGQSSNSVTIEYYDELEEGIARREIFVEGDRMWVPVPNLGFNEIFTRIEPSEVPAAPAPSDDPDHTPR